MAFPKSLNEIQKAIDYTVSRNSKVSCGSNENINFHNSYFCQKIFVLKLMQFKRQIEAVYKIIGLSSYVF